MRLCLLYIDKKNINNLTFFQQKTFFSPFINLLVVDRLIGIVARD